MSRHVLINGPTRLFPASPDPAARRGRMLADFDASSPQVADIARQYFSDITAGRPAGIGDYGCARANPAVFRAVAHQEGA